MTTVYLIDPFARDVRHVEITSSSGSVAELHELYSLLDCQAIEAVAPFNTGSDLMLVDENGKINRKPDQAYFYCRLWPLEPLAGRALWIGKTPEGDIAAPRSELDYVSEHIVWSQRI